MDGALTDDQVHDWLQEIAEDGFLSLHFDVPALGGVDKNEIGGGGYKRFKVSWSRPANRAIWTLVDAKFSGLTRARVTYFGVWNKQNKGMLRAYAELPEPAQILTGKGYTLHAGEVAISIG